MMVNQKQKRYRGCLVDEEISARMYDKAAIQYQGLKAKTNFTYNK